MAFDAFTLLAQLFNFALLVVLLRVFLYRPVLATMRRREELAAAALNEAERLREEAEAERRALAEERAAEERERAARLAALEEELERLRNERLGAVEREAEEARAARAEALTQEVERAVARLRPELARIVLDEVSQTVAWLTGEVAERLAVQRFLQRLRELPPERLADLRQAAARRDVHTFIDLLIPADVVIPAQVEVSDVDSLYDGTFPWLVTGDPSTWAIPMFSSAALLERVAATGTPRLQAGFLDAVANWPGEEYTLCLDPGAASELILTGEEVRDLAEAVISEAVAADG